MHDTILNTIKNHNLPAEFINTVNTAYQPMAHSIKELCQQKRAQLIVGVQGPQGSGKTTLAHFVSLILQSEYKLRVAVISIDDFYLTHKKRQQLAQKTHPLLATRGVPGTHDLALAFSTIKQLQTLTENKSCSLPRFNKAIDDRAPNNTWPSVSGPIDVIIFEGWCVGMTPQ